MVSCHGASEADVVANLQADFETQSRFQALDLQAYAAARP